jgi:imidazolonepropionase
MGGAQLAAELGAASADHLEWVDGQGMAAMAEAGVAPVLCPLVPLFLGESKEAPGRALIDAGLAPALSTDFNPGSCYLQSLPEVASWGALRYGFQAAEGLTAITLNAAASLGRGASLGSLEAGKQADICVTDLPSHRHLAYELGRSPVRAVIKAGRVVFHSNSRIR